MNECHPPLAGDINSECPNPDMVATRRSHFGHGVWQFECPHADEVYATEKGIVIRCAVSNSYCCVDDGKEIFVSSPEISPLKDFLETTLNYLGLK